MQVMPSTQFLPSLLHQQFLARGLTSVPPHSTQVDPTTPPSSEDNMSPPPRIDSSFSRHLDEESLADNQDTYEREKARDFKCPLCSENMTSLKEFTSHLRGHNEVKPTPDPTDPTGQAKVYHCCLCGKMLSSFSSLDRHMLVHSGERPFSCEVCGQTFTTNGNMHRHRRTHNIRDSCESDGSGGSAGKKMRKRKAPSMMSPIDKLPNTNIDRDESYAPLRCPICSEHFFSELSLEVHVISLHPGKEIRCDDCSHPCPTYNYFKLHRNMFHFKLGSVAGFPPLPPQTPYNGSLPLLVASQEKAHHSPLVIPSHFSPVKREQPDLDISVDLNSSFCSENGQQDDDPVLKEMKLKGEFPCRLCSSVFPNLRALKGHNKEHLLIPPFECNVGTCQYNTSDKSNLLQHMRGHTGQKPFECKICNFGFTTKANCERHVKNKHNKNSKEDVRDHIIIHEGDDESNSFAEPSRDSFLLGRHDTSYENDVMTGAQTIFPPTPPRSSAFIPYRPFDVEHKEIEKIKSEEGDEAPLDLSKPAIDTLVNEKMKATNLHDLKTDAKDNNNLPYLESMSQKTDIMPSFPNARFPFTLPFFNGSPAAPLWPPNLGLNAMNPAAFPFNPMHLAALLAAKNEEFKKNAEALQVKETAAALHNLNHMQDLAAQRGFISQISPSNSSLSAISPQNSPQKQSIHGSDNESNYKMIIKNGILMRKQKQRRYRTERPYGCDQCTARFTLRSNMDRHMKQQHPDTYNQKPRSGPGRKPAFQDDELVSNGPPNAKEEDLELIRKEESQKDGFESEEEEGFLDEEEDEQDLIIDDIDTLPKPNEHHTFTNISQFFGNDEYNKHEYVDIEAGSESSGGSEEKKKSAYSAAPHKMSCPYCARKFPWSSSLNRHILTHTGQKPYKCTECPLWFTTKSNCDRHILRKHGNNNNIDEKDFDHDDMCSAGEEEDVGLTYPMPHDQREFPSRRDSTSDSPYKCHICDEGFSERVSAINHIETNHIGEYKSLIEKGAFDSPEEVSPQPNESGEELYDQLRGKFPDYVNRKIICLFCSRKFWSAEDLRRHVRTHTGERPYSCDICNRRFTLKHSMLRHKKKHDSGVSSNGEGSDDDTFSNHSSSGGRSTPDHTLHSQVPQAQLYDQKRANLTNLMEKINRLNSAPDGL
eukprot:TRINITY_DN8821_c0_g1_i1.p1 TRINITY_DN8821_c0_g1~~TRINITY_DN8821_c0_g1_i1.p1  ORF type:complete len:1154 (-),score=219.81 TRINITY_DN8821_c0_g1_i1:142-3603(-)